MTIYKVLLSRGYFPKELPPVFFSELFAKYATGKAGRIALSGYKPQDNLTDCVRYELALAGGHRRTLSIPHPFSYATTAGLVAKHFTRLLTKAASKCSRSRPVFSSHEGRALQPAFRITNLARERAIVRSASRFLLRLDVSHFYPSLYTHAVGWAIDPKLRQKKHWKNYKLLGKKLDQQLMDSQAKISQGIPIGSDISFLLAEAVLTQIDRSLKLTPTKAFRWFDDYEIGCDTLDEANALLASFQRLLERFNLRVNAHKTKIIELPCAASEPWQTELYAASRHPLANAHELIAFFDTAFGLRTHNRDAYVLSYAIGLLFKLPSPSGHSLRVAQSALSQAMLAEPGCVQKALALLSYWSLNGSALDYSLVRDTISKIVIEQRHRGLSSDVAWALFYCLQNDLTLSPPATRAIADTEDNCIALLALHMKKKGLLASKFKLTSFLTGPGADPDGRNWLFLYEAHRLGFVTVPAVSTHSLFSKMLQAKVAFYREAVPKYAALIHPGSAPPWIVRKWITPPATPAPVVLGPPPSTPGAPTPVAPMPVAPTPVAPAPAPHAPAAPIAEASAQPSTVQEVSPATPPIQKQIAQDALTAMVGSQSPADTLLRLMDMQSSTSEQLDEPEEDEFTEEPGGYGGLP